PLKKEILANAQKTVEIPGFRKGHAPIDQIEAKYAEGIKEELTDKVLKKYFGEVVTAENLKPISPMYNVNVKMDEETFEVTCSVDVFPEVTLGEYKGI
ncbi:trigger factor family protein, partial [Acinetobacter baumannii]|nr:trigger factor family protein [Acinetobacter baumannii]